MIKISFKKQITVIAVIALLLFLHYSKLSAPLENALNFILKPLFSGFYSLSSNINQAYQGQTEDKQALAIRLRQAQERLNQLIAENARLKFLQDENTELRKHLNFLSKSQSRYLMANIISRGELTLGNAENSQTIMIDKGASDGLFAGLPVLSSALVGASSQGVIIGKIVEVKDNIAEIFLVTNKNSKLAASILGETKTSGIVRGDLGLTIKMDFIPQTENIKVGAIVATSGLEQNIPRGLVIGRVSEVKRENNEVWQSAIIEPMVNLDILSIAAILLPS